MKKLLTIAIVACFALSFAACGDDVDDIKPSKLDTPLNLECTSDSTQIVVEWDAVEGASTYTIEVKDANNNVVYLENHETSPVTITNLEKETQYFVRVTAVPSEIKIHANSNATAWALVSTKEGKFTSVFKEGKGTEDNPYIIKTAPQLVLLAQKTNAAEAGYVEHSVYYELGDNIDLSGYDWKPIGAADDVDFSAGLGQAVYKNSFKAYFDGKNYTITNMKVNIDANAESAFGGLFGVNEGSITNVNVEGDVVVSNSHANGDIDVAFAGGLCALNKIVSNGGTTTGKTGYIVNISYKGSVTAKTSSATVGTCAGGIVGYNNSGNVDECTVDIEADKAITSIGGSTSTAGGVIGDLVSGRTHTSNVSIKGSVSAIFAEGTSAEYVSAYAGGVAGSIYQTENTSSAAGLTDHNVDISGSVKAIALSTGSEAYVGGITGNVVETSCGLNNVKVSGELAANGTDAAYTGGIVGNIEQGTIGTCTTDISGTLSATTTEDVARIGGIAGNLGGSSNPATTHLCKVTISGKINANSAGDLFIGGVVGWGRNVNGSGCHFTSTSTVTAKGNSAITFGGIDGCNSTGVISADYAILDGKFSFEAPSDATVRVGGGLGFLNGMTSRMKRYAYACYAVINGTIDVSKTTDPQVGGFLGFSGTYGITEGCYWWADAASGVSQGHGTLASKAGLTQLAGKDKSSFDAILSDLNTVAQSHNFEYAYDSSFGYYTPKAYSN